MMRLIVITGISGAGKDTAAAAICKYKRAKVMKFAQPMKDVVEHIYQLQPGSLNRPEFKVQASPAGCSWSELMIRWWLLSPQIDPAMWLNMSVQEIGRILCLAIAPVFTDIRNQPEVDVILGLTESHPLDLIMLKGRGHRLESDRHLADFEEQLHKVAERQVTMMNSSTAADLQGRVMAWIDEPSSTLAG